MQVRDVTDAVLTRMFYILIISVAYNTVLMYCYISVQIPLIGH